MKKALTILLIFCFGVAHSTTYYIRTDGNNSNTGTVNSSGGAWLTLTYASTHTSIGDIIHVVAGTYLEAGQVFIIPGVSIEGDGITSILKTNWTTSFFGFIDMTSTEGTNGNQHISNLKFDGQNLSTPRGIDVEGRSNVEIRNCTVVDFKEEGIIFSGTDGFTGGPPSIYAIGNSFHDNTVTNCSRYAGFGTGCLGIGGQSGMLVYNDTITQLLRTPPEQVGWPIKYFNEGWTQGVKIYNNIITKSAANGEGWNFCLEMFNNSGLEIYGNTFQGSLDFNFAEKGSFAYSVYIHDNTIGAASFNFNHTEDGVIVEYPIEGIWVKKNIFRNLSTGVTFYTRPSALIKDVQIEQNLFANFGNSIEGVGGFVGGFGNGTDKYTVNGLKVYNNTFAGLAANRIYNGVGLGDCDSGQLKNIDIRNNSFQNITNDVFKIGGSITPDSVIFAYNNVKDITYNSTPNFSHTPTHYTSTPNYTATPVFIDTVLYQITTGSPFIDAGQDVGLPFFNTAPDIGYFEFGSNIFPTANAGPDQSITLPTSSVTMAGSGTDADGTIVSHVWTQVGGPITATITTPSSYTSTVTGMSTAGTYTFRLTVTDNNSATGTDDMVVTVNAGDITPPTVSSVTPTNGSSNVSITVTPTSTFSEALASGTVNTTNVTLTQAGNPVSISVGLASNVITITPSASLTNSLVYTVTLKTGITDVAGNHLASQYTYSFTTIASNHDIQRQYFILTGGGTASNH